MFAINNMLTDPTGFPMMSTEEVTIINDLIRKEKPENCLEWGSGNSTLYFPKLHTCIKHWLSIEHLGKYIKHLTPDIDKKVSLMWIPENEWYVDCVKHQGKKYDFILIDGYDQQREKCLEVAMQIAKEGAIVLLHDSGRESYRKFLENYGSKVEILSEGEKEVRNGFFAHRGLARIYV